MSTALRTLTLGAALGCGAMGGVFFAFSTFVMDGLARLPAPNGIAAMQSINLTAVRPAFMTLLFGTAVACVSLTVVAFRGWGDRSATLLLAGSALYLLGVIGLTIAYHVPHNDTLAELDPNAAGAAAQWAAYLQGWTRWNHVRAATALAASAAFIVALRPDR